MPERCSGQPQAPFRILVYIALCLMMPASSRGGTAGVPLAPPRCLLMHLQAELHLPARLGRDRDWALNSLADRFLLL